MSELPKGWVFATGEDLFNFITSGSRGWASHYSNSGAKFLRVQNIQRGGIELLLDDVQHVSPPAGAEGARTRLQCGDVVITITADLGRVGLIPSDIGEAYVNQHVALARPRTTTMSPYLAWFMTSRDAQDQLGLLDRGATRAGLGLKDIGALRFSLPPLPEQRRIVAKIDSLSGKTKRARDHLDHVPRLVEKYKRAVLAAAFRGDLTRGWQKKIEQQSVFEHADQLIARTAAPEQSRGGREATTNVKAGVGGISINNPGTEPPAGWSWVSLRRIARQETGHTPSRSHPDYWDGGVPWIGIRDAGNHHGQVINETLQTISNRGLENSSARLLPAGTVCLSRTASVGYVTIMGRSMATSQDFATWTCTSALLPKYLMYALMAEGDDIREFGEGSTHTTIYFPEIRAFHICLAPLMEQQEIVRRVEAALTWIDRLAVEATIATKLVDQLDQAVLAKAFRGELVQQDPTDEPASVLLDRIRSERVSAAVGKPKHKARK